MSRSVLRRDFLKFAGAGAALAFSGTRPLAAKSVSLTDPRPHTPYPIFGSLRPIQASQDRIVKETVGLRPFRKSGPNLNVVKLGDTTVVHNYGHGGSGWSLSWGTSREAVDKALSTGEDAYAVVGCGAVGMTSAVLLLRAGKKVTVYTKESHPFITSSMATGVWSPDSRICLEEHATPEFGRWWDQTCRASFKMYQHYLGLPGVPIEWVDTYAVSDKPWDVLQAEREAEQVEAGGPEFARFRDYVKDLYPGSYDVDPGGHPFSENYVRRGSRMIYNISAYVQTLLGEIRSQGARVLVKELHSADDFQKLPEKTVINATGLGSKTLFGDEEVVPVRGQLTFLTPDPEVRYQFSNSEAYVIPRRDGLVVGANGNGRYGSTDLAVDPQQSFDAVAAISRSMRTMRTG